MLLAGLHIWELQPPGLDAVFRQHGRHESSEGIVEVGAGAGRVDENNVRLAGIGLGAQHGH